MVEGSSHWTVICAKRLGALTATSVMDDGIVYGSGHSRGRTAANGHSITNCAVTRGVCIGYCGTRIPSFSNCVERKRPTTVVQATVSVFPRFSKLLCVRRMQFLNVALSFYAHCPGIHSP